MGQRGWMIATALLIAIIGIGVTYGFYVARQTPKSLSLEASAARRASSAGYTASRRVTPPSGNGSASQFEERRSSVARRVRLRADPSLDSAVLGSLQIGDELVITGPTEQGSGMRWCPVELLLNRDVAGYVASEFLEPAC